MNVLQFSSKQKTVQPRQTLTPSLRHMPSFQRTLYSAEATLGLPSFQRTLYSAEATLGLPSFQRTLYSVEATQG